MSPRREPAAALLDALRERKVLVVGGAGGVGKTTTAAARSRYEPRCAGAPRHDLTRRGGWPPASASPGSPTGRAGST